MVGIDQEYSPAGNTIAFSDFNRGGVQAAIYLMGPHGTNVRELSPPSLQAREPGLVTRFRMRAGAPDGRTRRG